MNNENYKYQIKQAKRYGIDIAVFENKHLGWRQLKELILAYNKGLIVWWNDNIYSVEQMKQLRLGAEKWIDIKAYANPKLNPLQMEQIRLGLIDSINVYAYNNPNIHWKTMEQLRLKFLAISRRKTILMELERDFNIKDTKIQQEFINNLNLYAPKYELKKQIEEELTFFKELKCQKPNM